jgi:hypothetical protein
MAQKRAAKLSVSIRFNDAGASDSVQSVRGLTERESRT